MSLFKGHNDDLKAMIGKGVAKRTWTNFNTSYRHVSEFLYAEYKVKEINILSLDLEFIKKFYQWLRVTRNLGHNSSLKNIANMKKIVISCVDNSWLRSDPFVKFDETREDVQPVFLVKEELQAIAEKEFLNVRLCQVRDVFIFCCFTGLAFADVKQLKKSEVDLGVDGELRIYKGRQKTGTPSIIPLLPITKQILAK
nr:site-specific integrase [Mucilaginibacter roseus]